MRKLGFPRLDDELRALVRRASTIEAAPAGAKARVLANVEALAGPPGYANAGAGASGHETGPSSAPRASPVGPALVVAGAFALGAAVGALAMYRVMQAQVPPETTHVITEREVSMATEHVPELPAPTPSTVATEVGAAASVPPVDPAASVVRERPAPSPAASFRKPSAIDALDPLANERSLLDLARSAIEREDGAAALDATAEHARKYPGGVLVQEREAIAVRALVLLGRTEEARARVVRFRGRFPDSMLLPALESNAGLPSTP
jgi:hypothetical protein